ncbi:MAG: rhomboid family intramembrane serine protease [Bacteroidia bacterium]|nr:rhomboid family intramembrane serine protease [Bacteroidia bacterium]
MSFGFPPQHSEELYLEKFTKQQFLVLALEAARALELRIDFISDTGFVANTNKGRFKRNFNVAFKIDGEKAVVKSESIGSELMDWGRNKKIIEKFSDAFIDLKYSLKPEELDQKYEEIVFTQDSQGEDLLDQSFQSGGDAFLSAFIPRKGYFISPILINLNILIWIAMVITGTHWFLPDTDSLIKWGANFSPMTLEGQAWRLITCCFIHIGILHLLMNMYALIFIGLLLEPRLGKTNFIAAYLLTGIVASVTSLWWNDAIVSAGASGAIFGMYGVFLAMLTTNLIEKHVRKALLSSIAIFVVFNLLNGLKEGIDNAAHLGGLISGLVIGYALIPGLKRPEKIGIKYITISALTVLILTSTLLVYKKIPNDIGTYDVDMQKFITQEQLALGVYQLPQNASNEVVLYELKDRGIYYWNENIKLIESFKYLNLPIEIRTKNRLLIEYCELRIKSYELIYKAVSEDTDRYESEIEKCIKLIESKVTQITGEPMTEH